MRHSNWLSLACIPLIAAVSLTAQPPKTYRARLSPVPLDVSMQATVAGTGSVSAVLTGTRLAVTGTFDGIKSPATIARIHKSPVRGVRGPTVLDLMVPVSARTGPASGAAKARVASSRIVARGSGGRLAAAQ